MKKIFFIVTSVIVACSLIVAVWYGNKFPREERRSELLLGTICEITLVDASKELRSAVFDDAFNTIRAMDALMSIYRGDSEISRVNREAVLKAVTVSPDLFFVVEKSKELSAITKGAFDITTLPLSQMWGFTHGEGRMPTAEDIAAVLDKIGSRNIILEPQEKGQGSIRFEKDGVQIDLGGIAKGYICDVVAAHVKKYGIKSAMVNIGGTIFAYGKPSHRPYWAVGIRDPRDKSKSVKAVILDNKALATSGDYEQFFIKDGKRYTHIIDPRTGWPASGMLAVTVCCQSAMVADAFSTGLFVLGPEESMKLLSIMKGIDAFMIYEDGNEMKQKESASFSKLTITS
jgi:FAD:protein FMN transferase